MLKVVESIWIFVVKKCEIKLLHTFFFTSAELETAQKSHLTLCSDRTWKSCCKHLWPNRYMSFYAAKITTHRAQHFIEPRCWCVCFMPKGLLFLSFLIHFFLLSCFFLRWISSDLTFTCRRYIKFLCDAETRGNGKWGKAARFLTCSRLFFMEYFGFALWLRQSPRH